MQEFYNHVLGQAELKRTVAETNNLLLLYISSTRNGLWRRNFGVEDQGSMRTIDNDVISFFIIINVTI